MVDGRCFVFASCKCTLQASESGWDDDAANRSLAADDELREAVAESAAIAEGGGPGPKARPKARLPRRDQVLSVR